MNEPTVQDSVPPTGTVLVLDDEADILATLRRQLRREFHVLTATTPNQARVLLDRHPVDVVIADQRLPDASGAEFLREVYQSQPNTVRILLTGYPDLTAAIQAINEGRIYAYLAKPWDPLELRALLSNAIRDVRLHVENLRLLDELRVAKERLESRVDEQTRALHESEESFHNVVRKNRTGILLVNMAGVILFANPAAEALLGRDGQTLVGSEFGIPAVGGKTEITVLRPDGRRGTAELTVTETQWRHRPAHLLMLHDITERQAAESQVRYLAQHDSLTGLPNRALFADRLDQALLRARRGGVKAAILFMDLDRFKEVNDSLGHKIGDQLLQQVASRLADAVRQSDTVARMGGDEFIVLLEGLNGREQAGALTKKLRDLFDQPIPTEAGELFAIPSIGVSLYPDDADDAETLIQLADSAMYHAKRHKELHICFYSKELDTRNRDRLSLENSLRHALDRNEFVLHYQIQIDLRTRRPIGMEALVRWRRSDRGLVPPNDFIPLLEETGLILPVGDWILAEACRQMREWRHIGLDPVPVAVNISPKQLADQDFIQTIQDLLARNDLRPNALKLELTENAVMQDQVRALHILRALREQGIELHMDDFGVGYSSLGLLKQLPFDVVKVDRSFIVDLLDDPGSALLTRAIVNVAHGLKKRVVAEGVETEAQAAHLLYIGCDYAQGWLYGKPLPAADMTAYLRGLLAHPVHPVITPTP
ncbi:MAG: EAL domain-containing protein [Candidatus Competibacter sp.]|nr:EAL domain-containing protein [Candidatus Competibacter sp.]MDG4584563.1 EAL domain-containing protein [Candidatus Competibacter sp.]